MTTTDPAAIDLDAIKKHPSFADIRPLIAAVEALRKRVKEMEDINIASYEDFQLAAGRAIAEAARVVALEGALEDLRDSFCASGCINLDREHFDECNNARDILSATPGHALERARAVEAIIDVAREIISPDSAWTSQWVAADSLLKELIDTLDALGKEEGL